MRGLGVLLAGAVLSPLLSACVVHVTDDGPRVLERGARVSIQTAQLEPVRSARIADGRLYVRVDSNGCTDTEDFAVHIDVADSGAVGLGVEREDPDLCKALVPDGVELSWSLQDLDVTASGPFRLLNPLKL